MNLSRAIPAKSNVNRPLQALLRTTSITRRSVIASALTACTLLVSSAATAPVHKFMLGGANVATMTPAHAGSGAAGGDEASAMGGAMLADDPGALAGKPVRMELHSQHGFLATQMAFLGEAGSDIQFSDDASLPNLDAGTDGTTTLLHEPALLKRLGNHGDFGSAAHQTGLAGAMTAAWTGTAGDVTGSSGSNTAMNVANKSAPFSNNGRRITNTIIPGHSGDTEATGNAKNVGNAQGSNCSGSPCPAPDLMLALAPLTVIETGTVQVQTTAPAPSRADGASPPLLPLLPLAAGAGNPPQKSAPLAVKALPATVAPDLRLLAAADQPSVAMPEPSSIALLGFGMTLLLVATWRRRARHYV